MNKKNIYIDDYNNVHSVLIQENIIETMKNRINYLEKRNISYNDKKKFFPTMLSVGTITSLLGSPIIIKISDPNMFYETVDSIFGKVNSALLSTIVMSSLFISIGVLYSFKDYYFYRNDKKMSNEIKSELDNLKKQLEKESKYLTTLKKDKSIEEGNLLKQINVNDYCRLYYDLGYNGSKYYKHYKQSILNEKLSNKYSIIDVELIEEYFDQNDKSSNKILKK